MRKVEKILVAMKKKLVPTGSMTPFQKVLNTINQSLVSRRVDAVAVFGGSIAKGTNIKGDFDCDIFVRFSKRYSKEDISSITEEVIALFKPQRVHGSRDYFQFKKGKNKFEVVPVINVASTSEILNTTDASPLHAGWVRAEIKKKPYLADEIRLTKQFCKGIGVYGAESYIKGFSGHVVDILTIHYGGFLKLLSAAAKWKDKTIIDHYNIHKGLALSNLNSAKIESPLVLIDPIESGRNAAASLSKERFERFISQAKEFLKKPSASFFVKKKVSIPSLRKAASGKELVLFFATPLPGKEDIVGTKMLKAFEYVKTQFLINDFPIIDSGWEWDKKGKATFWLISQSIPSEKIWMGPPLIEKKAVTSFKDKHKKTFEKSARIYARVTRRYTKPQDFLRFLVSHEQVAARVKKVSFK